MDNNKLAKDIVEHVGGKENIIGLVHCATRLRFSLADNSKINESELKNLEGVLGVVSNSAQPQVIIGNKVNTIYNIIMEQTGIVTEDQTPKQKQDGNIIMRAIMVVPKVFTPILPAFVASSLLKALFAILQLTGLIDTASSTYQMLNLASDVAFYFLPVLIAVSASKIFKTNTYMAAIIAAVLLHPSFTQLVATGDPISLFGLPVPLVNYATSLIPAIIGVWLLSYVERFFNRYIPESLRYVFAPLLTFLVMFVVMFVVIGPIGYYFGMFLASAMMSLYETAGVAAIVLIAVFKPFLVLTGMHYALAAAFLPVFLSLGYDAFYMVTAILPNLGQAGAAFGVFLRAKDKNLKALALSTSFSAFMGISEPALFGINLKYRRPLVGAMIGSGFGALYAAIMGVKFVAMANFGVIGILGVMPEFMLHMVIAAMITLVVSTGATFVLGFEGKVSKSKTTIENKTNENNVSQSDTVINIASAMDGEIVPLNEVSDPAFSSEAIGKGIAVLPKEGKAYAPADGVITVLFQTGHAIGITTEEGVELLIHIGIDTVSLNGKYFTVHVKQGDKVKQGDLLVEFDIEGIEKEGYETVTPIIVTNTDNYLDVLPASQNKQVQPGDVLLSILKN
ncbi:beta-glucoside-specific PTS transporter subunit IIABC [Jeotgalibaca sp. MA1X17-3]|uniref:beta-glucoside-specific PTS transporter subunit IIABC n=1 Tax=Jeotgalibaca sp. MA1X17-3 TaxID=2908211 RepID=UPI001F46B64C|nr:beta-glucoside-specific PTS transporter subunit IIABC [Jeotgalibaca sp. MA1X17-3]UJF15966.1 beta-glucoside-specific PTS transporter subunit IIABC [Jeotgalibaca sp. MA1X17-3]